MLPRGIKTSLGLFVLLRSMPPALIAELEDVAAQLARFCGELRLGDDEDGDREEGLGDSDLDHDDDEFAQEMEDNGDRESLVLSLAAATSECEALMKLLGEDCDSLR